MIGTRESLQFLLQSPQPLAPARQPLAGARQPPAGEPLVSDVGHLSQTCPEDVAVALRRAAADAGATLNDLLLRDLFLTVRSWQAAAGAEPGRKRLRILMPQNLRTRDDRGLPAANVMSFAFLTRRADQWRSPGACWTRFARRPRPSGGIGYRCIFWDR